MIENIRQLELANNSEKYYQLAYTELKQIAHNRLRQERINHTFATTDLVHEAYLKLSKQHQQNFVNQDQFLAIASQSMRRILIDYARQQKRQKRGGDLIVLTLNEEILPLETTCEDLLIINEALDKYKGLSERGATIIEYWFFGGYKRAEIANFMGISEATIGREWRLGRAWLNREIRKLKAAS